MWKVVSVPPPHAKGFEYHLVCEDLSGGPVEAMAFAEYEKINHRLCEQVGSERFIYRSARGYPFCIAFLSQTDALAALLILSE